MKINTANNHRKTFFIALGVVVFLLLCGLAYAYATNTEPFQEDKEVIETPTGLSSSKNTEQSISYSPPTSADINESQAAKENIAKNESKPTESSVQVGIANTYQTDTSLEVRAFTPSVVEGGGKCTAILTKSQLKVTAETEAFVDATTSQCRPIVIPLSEFSEVGIWKLTVSYKSNNYTGTSPEMDVEI